jgi:hypothetical protein
LKCVLDGGANPPTSTIRIVMKEKILTAIEMIAEFLKGIAQSL